MFNKIQNTNKGFTLVEILVAITIFVLVIGVAFNVFIYVLQSQRKTLAYQELLDQTSFAIEYMTRNIRMAKKQRINNFPIDCLGPGYINRNYQRIANNHLRFIRWDYVNKIFICYEFQIINNRLGVSRNRGVSWTPLTSPGIEVTNLRFNIKGDTIPAEPPLLQPRVTIVLEVRGREYSPGLRSRIHLQTTVSQRDLDL